MISRLQCLKFCLLKSILMCFVISCLYIAVSLTLVREQRFIRTIIKIKIMTLVSCHTRELHVAGA